MQKKNSKISGHLVAFGWKRDCSGLFKFSIHCVLQLLWSLVFVTNWLVRLLSNKMFSQVLLIY